MSYEESPRALGTFGQGRALVEKAQKQVFRLNPWRAKLTGFIASEENRPPSLLCIPLKHEMLPNVNNHENRTIGHPLQQGSRFMSFETRMNKASSCSIIK